METTGDLGRRVPARHLVTVLAFITGLFFLGVLVTAGRQVVDGSSDTPAPVLLGIAAGVLVLVLLPFWGAYVLARRRVYVSPEAITVTSGETVKRTLRLDRLEEVQPVVDGSQSVGTPEFFARAVVLRGRDQRDRRTGLKLSATSLDMDPVFAVLEPEVQRRPDLLKRDADRKLFAEYLAAKGRVEG
jgi:hypothetical protein